MPNWCSTTFVFHGSDEDLTKLDAHVNHAIDPERTDNKGTDFKANWLGNILLDLGIDKEDVCHGDDPHYRCRGWIEDVMYDADIPELRVYTETAWDVMDEMWEYTIKKLGLDIQFSYCAEEPGCRYYVKHNASGHNDFPEKVYIDAYLYGDELCDGMKIFDDVNYFDDEEQAVKWLNGYFKTDFTELDEFDDLIDEFNDNEEKGDQYIYVHRFEEV